MSTNIQDLIQTALGDGARSTKFDALFNFTNADLFPDQKTTAVLVKSTNFPSKSHQVIDFRYKGRNIPIKGQIKYANTWECTFYLDENHKIKNAFEAWIEAMDETVSYPLNDSDIVRSTKEKHRSLGTYTTDISIFQQDFSDTKQTVKYVLHNCFPTEVSSIQLSAEGPGNLLEFSVTFAFSYFDLLNVKGEEGNFIENFIGSIKDQITNAGSQIVGALNDRLNSEINAFLDSSGINSLINETTNGLLNSFDISKGTSKVVDLIKGTNTDYSPGAWLGKGISGVTSALNSSIKGFKEGASDLYNSAVDSVSDFFD